MDNANLVTSIVGSVVRFALAGVVGGLVTRGVITQDQATMLIPAIVMGVITIAWSVSNKYGIKKRIDVALGLPAGSGPVQLEEAVKRQ